MYFGVEVVVAALVIAAAALPAMGLGGMSSGGWTAWAGTLALVTVVSIAVHEVAHAFVAWVFRLGVKHLFIGIDRGHTLIRRADPPWWQSGLVSFAGPASNLALAALAWWQWSTIEDASSWLDLLLAWAFWVNGILGVTNLLPFLGVDGGGVLHALAVPFSKDQSRAARNARWVGALVLASVPAGLGFFSLVQMEPSGLLLLIPAGWLIASAARAGKGTEEVYRLTGATVAEAMGPGTRIAPGYSARTLVDAQIRRDMEKENYREPQRPYVVMDESGTVFGVLTPGAIREAMHEPLDWHTATVAHLMLPVAEVPVVTADLAALSAVTVAFSSGSDVLLVVEDGELVGCLSLADLERVIESAA